MRSRCKDGWCGADDCDNCNPQEPDRDELANQADMENDAKREREMWVRDYEREEERQKAPG